MIQDTNSFGAGLIEALKEVRDWQHGQAVAEEVERREQTLARPPRSERNFPYPDHPPHKQGTGK